MRALTGELLLAAWEAAARAHALRRPLALLSAALPGSDLAALSALPVAARNRELLRLRELSFGPELVVFGTCPECGERLEFTLRTDEVAARLDATTGASAGTAASAADPVEWTENGHRYRLRPVTTDDLAATLTAADPAGAQAILLARCLEVRPERPVPPAPLPPSPLGGPAAPPPVVPPSALKHFEELHADTEIRCAIDCPGCSGHQVLDLDIARFLWREVAIAASRLLAEVHVLASAYGWREQDIVQLRPHRRAAYLELAGP